MLTLTDEELKRWKETFAKDGIVYQSDNDYLEAVHNLIGFIDTLIQIDLSSKQKASSSDVVSTTS